jgi:hypothetical protein
MDRVRIGLTGLAAVFLLTLIGAVGFRDNDHASVAKPRERPAEEPLAELGVAPGSASSAVKAEAENMLTPPAAPAQVVIIPPPPPSRSEGANQF